MRRLVVLGDLAPKRLRILVLADVEEGDGGIGKGRGAEGCRADGCEREMTKAHRDLLPGETRDQSNCSLLCGMRI